MKKLEWLNLASNSLNVMDDNALGNLHSLLHLNMAHNRFVALPSDLFHEAKYLQVFTTYIYFYFDKLYLKYEFFYRANPLRSTTGVTLHTQHTVEQREQKG